MSVAWYEKQPKSGLRTIVRELGTTSQETSTLVRAALELSNSGKLHCRRTHIEALTFINLDPGNPSTIYTALLFAERECIRNCERSCMVTFDQSLYAKASEIFASVPCGELGIVTTPLGGFHLLMSFLGSIGYIMSYLFEKVYAKASVDNMLSGHAYSRASQKKTVAETSPTAKLWIQYLEMEELIHFFLRAEQTVDWAVHLHCVREMLSYLDAAGHFSYAKTAQLYLQHMEELESRMAYEEFLKFVKDGYYVIRRNHEL
ncbi:hypothetical protein PR048_028446 [Dryococelus australis]|uniref:Uncharacterized protein n=1 Tax=Dryococelus australis TaxID=614101 RepID=A0ABQ9GD51_9NEOP|nr:hypothetical protein PR048_028446 [Dryococelus australis]